MKDVPKGYLDAKTIAAADKAPDLAPDEAAALQAARELLAKHGVRVPRAARANLKTFAVRIPATASAAFHAAAGKGRASLVAELLLAAYVKNPKLLG
jgi:excinuclease UvrABC ATPase subunit